MRIRLAAVVAGFSLAAASGIIATSGPAAAASTTPAVPKLSHIMEVFLENETATATFEDPTANPALAALVKQGSYVPNYHGVGHASLDNYIADFSGEQPDTDTEADCAGMAPDSGCSFPASVPTLATTLDAAGDSWKIYAQGMATASLITAQNASCLHSASLELPDIYQGPGTDGYATRHNPAEWFHSVLDNGGSAAYCEAHDVDLTNLTTDEKSPSTLPTWSFIEPDTCNDGHDDETGTNGGCAADPEGPTAPSGTAAIDAWLPGFVKSVMTSPAWDSNSVMVITFDEAATSDTSGCAVCHDTSAGGRIGALFLGAPVKTDYTSTWNGDHYGLLRTVEASLGLPTLKSLAATPAAAATVHDGDPDVTPVTDIWAASAGAPAVASTSTTTTTSTTTSSAASTTTKTVSTTSTKATKTVKRTTAVKKVAIKVAAQPGGTLAYTGLPVALGILATGLLIFGLGGSRLLRRRRPTV